MPEDKPETDIIMIATGTGVLIPIILSCSWRKLQLLRHARVSCGCSWAWQTRMRFLRRRAETHKRSEQTTSGWYALSTNQPAGKMYIQDKVKNMPTKFLNDSQWCPHPLWAKGMMPGSGDAQQACQRSVFDALVLFATKKMGSGMSSAEPTQTALTAGVSLVLE